MLHIHYLFDAGINHLFHLDRSTIYISLINQHILHNVNLHLFNEPNLPIDIVYSDMKQSISLIQRAISWQYSTPLFTVISIIYSFIMYVIVVDTCWCVSQLYWAILCFENTGGGGGGGARRPPSDLGRSPRNLALASEIAQRERPRCYKKKKKKMHILLVMIIYANHMHKLCFSL